MNIIVSQYNRKLVKAQNLPLGQQILVQLIVCTLILSNNKLLIFPVREFHLNCCMLITKSTGLRSGVFGGRVLGQ